MKKSRMIFAAVACAALLSMVALFGCGGSSTTATVDESASGSDASAAIEAAASGEAVELQIFAANSLSKAMDEAQSAYTAANPNVTFKETQYKSSGELNELLAAGGEADMLISASKSKMEDATTEGYVNADTVTNMFTNDLVMVTAESNDAIDSLTLDDIASGQYTICVGDDSVPAGNYANQSLSTVGCFNDPDGKVGSDSDGKSNGTDAYAGTPIEGKVTTDTSVGNVCQKAQSGEVDVAFVYTSDVYRFGGVKVVGTVPGDTHKNIVYPGAICANSANADAAQAFMDWCLTDATAAQIWEKWGFTLASN